MSVILLLIYFIVPLALVTYCCIKHGRREVFSFLLDCKPYDVDGWQEYGRILFFHEDYRTCIYAMEQARLYGANCERHPDVWLYLYKSYCEEGEFEKADVIFDEAIKHGIDPNT